MHLELVKTTAFVGVEKQAGELTQKEAKVFFLNSANAHPFPSSQPHNLNSIKV